MATSSNERIEQIFPRLAGAYLITSPETLEYNCVAWGVGELDRWWQAEEVPGYYWPENSPRDGSVEALVHLFKSMGFEIGASPEHEPGLEKIAIYSKDGEYEHVARQLDNGHWTSKLGALEDIQHASLSVLEGAEYGTVAAVMKRAKA
jgi:hypothetical protein